MLRLRLRSPDRVNPRWMSFVFLPLWHWIRTAARIGLLLVGSASIPVVVLAEQNDTQTGVTGTEAADVLAVSEDQDTEAEVSTSSGDTLNATATGIDALGGSDTVSNTAGLATDASASASLTSQPKETKANATSTGVSAGEGDDQVTSSSTFTSTANAFGVYAGNLQFTPEQGAPPSKEINVSITTTGKATGVVTGAGADTVNNDALFAVTALATSGGTADQLNSTVRESVNVKSTSSSEASAKGIVAGEGNDSVTNGGVMLNTATATSGALAIALVAPQGTPTPDPQNPTAPPKPKKMQIKADASATARADAVGIDADEDETEDSSEDTSPFGLDGLRITYQKTVSTTGGDDTISNSVLLTNLATATSGAGSGTISDKVDGTVTASATSEATANSTGITAGTGNDTVTNSGELMSAATATAGALSLSLEVGAPSDTTPAPTPPPGQPPKPKAPTEDKENKASSKTSVTATAKAIGIDVAGSGQTVAETGLAEISDGALVVNYNKTVTFSSDNDAVTNQGAIQALGTATAASQNASVVISSGGSTDAESKSTATSYSAAILTGAGNDSITNSGILTSSATSDASALTLGLAVGKPQETAPPAGGGSTTPPAAAPSKLATSTDTSVTAEAEAMGIDAEGKPITTTLTRQLSIGLTGLRLSQEKTESGGAGDDTILNNGIVTSTANASADSTDAAIEMEAAGSVSSESEATAKAKSMGIYAGAGNDTITNNVLLTAGATATADALSVGLVVSKPPEQAPAQGTPTPPPAPDPNAKKDKSNVKVKAGATAQANAAGIDAEGAGHNTTQNKSLTIGGNALEYTSSSSDASATGVDTIVNRGVIDADATATSGAVAAGIVIQAAGSVDADATSKATATSSGIATGGDADRVDNSFLLQSDANATATALGLAVSVSQPTDSSGTKPSTLEAMQDTYSTARSAANAAAESHATGVDTESGANIKEESSTFRIGFDGLLRRQTDNVTSLAGDDEVTNSGAMLVTSTSLGGAAAIDVKLESEGTAASEAKADARAASDGVLTGGGSDVVVNSGEFLSSAMATAGALATTVAIGATPGASTTPAPAPGQPRKPAAPSANRENKASSNTTVTANARATGIDSEGSGQSQTSESIFQISLAGRSLTKNEQKQVNSAAGNDSVTNRGALQAIGTALAGSRNADIAISSSGSLSAESKATATSESGAIATGGGDDAINNSGLLTSAATATASAVTLGLAIGKPQETTPPAGGGGSGTPTTTQAPSKLTTSTETSVDARASAFGIDAEGKGTNTTSNRNLEISFEGLRLARSSSESSNAGNDQVLNDGVVTSTATASADSRDAAIVLDAVGSMNSESAASAKAASTGIYTGGGSDTITSNAGLSARSTATADSLSLGVTVSKPPEQAAGGSGGGTTPPTPAKKDKSNVKVDARATSEATATAIDAEGSQHDQSRSGNLVIDGNTLGLTLQRSHSSSAGADTVINRGIIDADAEAMSGALAAGIAVNAAGSMDADATSKAKATSSGILTGGGADLVDNTFIVRSEADATATALAVAVSVSQPTDSAGAKPTTLGKLKDIFATAHSVANAEAESTSTGIDTEGDAHVQQETLTIGNGGDGRVASAVAETISLAGDDVVRNSGAVIVSAGSLAGAGAAEIRVETEGTASSEAKADAKAKTGAVLTGGGNDAVTNSGALTSTATATAGALAVSFTKTGGLGAQAKSDARALSDAQAIGIASDAEQESRRTELALTLKDSGVELSLTDASNASSGADTIANEGLISSIAAATSGAAGAAITMDGSASSDVDAVAKARATTIDAGGGADVIGNDGFLDAVAVSTSNALSVAFGQKGEEKKSKSKENAEASSTAESIATGIAGDSGTNTLTEASLEITLDSLTVSLSRETEAASGNDVITNRGGVLSAATATSGAEGASIAIDGVAKADINATAKSRAVAIDGGGGNDAILNVGEVGAAAISTAGTVAASIGQKTSSESSARTKVSADTVADASAAGITTDGNGRRELGEAELVIDETGLAASFSSSSAAVSGNDVLENRNSVLSTAAAATGTAAVALTIKGAANAAANSSATANSLALDTGGGADVVLNRGTLTAGATATAATANAAISTEGRAINAGLMGAGTTAKSRAVGISTAGVEETKTVEITNFIDFEDIGVEMRLEFASDGLTADGNDSVRNTGDVTVSADAQAPRLNAGITGKGMAVSMGRATSETYAGGIDTGNLDDSIDNAGELNVTATSTAALANVAATGKGLAVAFNAVWDGGTEAEAVAAGINADSGNRTTTVISAEADADLARVRYNKDVEAASGDDEVINSGAITTFARAEAPSLNVGVVTGTGLAAAVSTATATSESTAIRGGDGADGLDNSGDLSSTAEALAASANVAVTNQGVAIAADAVWDGGTKANATAIGIAGDGGDRTRSTFLAVGTDQTTHESTSVLADGADTIANTGDIDARSTSQALSAGVAVAVQGVGIATATSTSTSRAAAIDAGAGTAVDSVSNSGELTAQADALAAAASVSVTNSGLALSADSVWDGGTKADARARGIDVGSGAETITNDGAIDATANSTTASAAVSVAISGVAGAVATSTGKADATAIDASAGNDADTLTNSAELTATADTLAASAAVSFTSSGLAIAADAIWDGGTDADARSRGIDVGEAADTVDNSGDITAIGEATAASLAASVAVSGVAGAISTSTATSDVAAIDTGTDAAADEVINSGNLTVASDATANTASVSFTMGGVALAADTPFDGGTGAEATARGIQTGLGADDITNTGDVEARAEATARSAAVAVAVSGVAGAIAKSTSTANAAALDAGDGADDDDVANSGFLTAISDAAASSAAVSFTAAGVAVAGGSAWDGGTRSDSRASGMVLGAGIDQVTNDGAVNADATARSTGIGVSVAVEGVAGAITAATADATAVGIDAAAGNDVIVSRANIDAASLANANTISAAGTKFGVSVAGNNSWDGGTTSNARSTGISGGAGLDTLTNSGNIESTADAVSPSVAVSFTVGGVAAAVSTARSTADAGAIDGGDDADDIDNSGALTVTADSDAVAVSVAVTGAGVGLAADSVWDGGTTARAQAGGIRGGAGNDDISNTTDGGSIDAIANSTATSVAGSVTGGGFAGSISTSTAIAESAAIDGGDGDDNVFSDSRVLARADARGTSLSVSIVGSGIAVASDAFWDGGTKGNATAAGIAGGAGDDDIINAGEVTAEAESESTSAAVAASQAPSFGLAAAIAASTSTARATALDAGAGTDELTNEGLLRADSSAAADGVSVSFTPFGGAITGSFDAATRADAFATGMAGAGGSDTLVNAGGGRLELESTAETRNLAVSLTLAGVSLADANAISTADGIGIDGGADADVLRNEGLISGTIDSEATSRALTFATGLSSASANSTGKATGAALVGGSGDDRIENLGNVNLAFNATATGQSLGGTQLGVALSDASAESVVDAAGQRGDAGADTLINAGTLRIDAGASTTARSISAAQLGVSLASANSTATSGATGLAGGDANDVIVNVADGEVDVLARANVNAGSVAIAVAGATQGEARTSSAVSATGLAGDGGDDTIGNAGLVRVRGLSESEATGGSVSVAGAARARAGTEVETVATGISGGAGADTIVNSGTLLVGPEDGDQWMSRLATGAASIGFAGDMDAQSAAFARTTSTGIAGGNDNDRISNTGDLSVTANARSDSGTGALTIFGSASGGGESGAFTRASGLDGAAGDDQLDTLGTLSVTAESRLVQTGTSFTFGGSGELGAALVAATEASGVNGGEGNDQIRTAGTIAVNADSLLTSSGDSNTVFGTSAAAGSSGATTRAVGIDGEAGDDRIDGAADMSIAATSELTMNSASYTFGGSGETGGALVASTSVEGILGGAGRDVIANSGAIDIDALSTLTSSNGSDTTFGGASSSVTSGGRSEARGLAGGDADDIIENRADGTIDIAATTRVNANAVAYTFLGGGSQNDAVLTGGADAVGMAGDAGSDILVNRGEIRVLADASLVSRGGAKTTVTATSDVASTGVSDVAAHALGMVGGDGDDAIESSGLLQVNAIGVAEARNEASNNGVSLLNNNVAGAVTRSDVEATGFAAGAGVNRTDIDGDATVTATSTAYALALSSGATVSFGSDGESRVQSSAAALATGAIAEDDDDDLNIDGSLTVTADATTAKRVLVDVIVFRDFRSNDENDNPSAPIRIVDAALPPLTDEDGNPIQANRDRYPPCTEESCTVVFWTRSPPEEQDPNNPSDVDGGHYIVVVETDDSDPPVETWSWDWVDAGLIQRQEIQEEVDAFPTYAAANGNGLTGRGFATASGTAEATARGVKLGEGDNSVQNRGALIVRADAEAVVNVSSDGDGTGNAEGGATTTATAHAVGIELGNGNDQVLNAGEISVTAVSTAQSLATVTGGDICIWFFGWWCGGGGDGIGTAKASLTTSATGIAAGGGTNRIVNDGDITVLAGPEVRIDSRNDEYVADVRQENRPQTIEVTSSSRAIGIETGDGDDEIINNGSLSVEARDLASACDSGCQATPSANQVREDSVTAAGIVTGAGNDIVRNAGSLSALIVRNDVATATLAIDTGTGDDELSLGDGSSTIGNVRLGEGDDTLMLSGTPVIEDAGGTLINVDAGIGTDTLVLSGAGAYTGTPLSIERAAKIGAGTYTLSSLVSMQSLTIDEGTLQVDSDYQFHPNGTYSTFFQVTGDSGLLDVNGSATLGGAIEVEKRGNTYVRDGSRYTVVQSDEGLEEAFDTISLPESRRLLSFSLEQSPGVLDVVADAASFATVTENPHLRQIATNLDRIAPTGTGDLDDVFGTLQSMDGDFDRALASLSPEGHLATASDTLVNVRQMTTLLQGHLSDSRALYRYAPQLQAPSASLALTGGSGGIGSLQLSSAPRAFAAGSPDGFGDLLRFASARAGAAGSAASATGVRPIRSQIWMLGLSADSENEAVGGYSPFETESAGYLLGYDMHVGEQWIVGANVGHAASDVTLSDGTSRGDIDAWLGSAFATWFGERAYLEAGLSYGEQSFENTRMLVVGPIERRTYSEHDGNAWTAFAGGGYAIGTKLWSLEPYASLSYFYVEEEPFEETGADSLRQLVAGRSTEALFGEAGASLSLLQRIDTTFLDWHLSIALGYDFDIDQSRITYAYAGAPGTAFTIDDRDSARRSTVFGGGVSWLTGQSTLSLDYGARSSADHDEQFVSARMTVRF